MIKLARRGFITGIAAVIASPAIVRAASLMPVKAYETLPKAISLPNRASKILYGFNHTDRNWTKFLVTYDDVGGYKETLLGTLPLAAYKPHRGGFFQSPLHQGVN